MVLIKDENDTIAFTSLTFLIPASIIALLIGKIFFCEIHFGFFVMR